MSKHETWTLAFRDVDHRSPVPLPLRVRRLLKYALRAVGLRCVDIQVQTASGEKSSAAPPA